MPTYPNLLLTLVTYLDSPNFNERVIDEFLDNLTRDQLSRRYPLDQETAQMTIPEMMLFRAIHVYVNTQNPLDSIVQLAVKYIRKWCSKGWCQSLIGTQWTLCIGAEAEIAELANRTVELLFPLECNIGNFIHVVSSETGLYMQSHLEDFPLEPLFGDSKMRHQVI